MPSGGLPPGFDRLFGNDDEAAGRVLDVDLPPGALVVPYEAAAGARPAYWVSDAPAGADLWIRLRQAHQRSGLWPVLADPFEWNPEVPWTAGEVSPQPVAAIEGLEAGQVMAGFWAEWTEDGEEGDFLELEPFGTRWPGLAEASDDGQEPGEFADQFVRNHDDGTSRIVLVPAARSADVVTALGWQGPLNFNEDMAPFSAVMRSWEDRFGARLIQLGFDTLALTVAAPPVSARHAERVGAEHFAFCPDNVVQGPGTIRSYAAQLPGNDLWSFWWD
jgi:uncharacterized protein DUF4253